MRIATAIWCALLLVSGCAAEEEVRLGDKGLATWVAVDAPALGYRAVWGVNEREVIAVGNGGAAEGEAGVWRALKEVPAASYRAIWGRSASEIWIGGDGILLARAPTGWQEQRLFDGDLEVTDYSVLAMGGDQREEYAVVLTGGELLLFANDGSAWRTVYWRGGAPAWPLPQAPSLSVRDGTLLVGGAGDLVRCSLTSELGVALWEATRWPIGEDLPRLASVTGGPGFWAGAGGAHVVVLDDEEEEPALLASPRDARAIASRPDGALFVVGSDGAAACDAEGCAAEASEVKGLVAVWGDELGTVAAGDGGIAVRKSRR